jgi:hypothetical protein
MVDRPRPRDAPHSWELKSTSATFGRGLVSWGYFSGSIFQDRLYRKESKNGVVQANLAVGRQTLRGHDDLETERRILTYLGHFGYLSITFPSESR